MIIRPTLDCSHWWEFVYTECCHDVILCSCQQLPTFNDTTVIFSYLVKQNIVTNINVLSSLRMLPDNVVAVCGNQDEDYMIHCYNLETGELAQSVTLENETIGNPEGHTGWKSNTGCGLSVSVLSHLRLSCQKH